MKTAVPGGPSPRSVLVQRQVAGTRWPVPTLDCSTGSRHCGNHHIPLSHARISAYISHVNVAFVRKITDFSQRI